MESINNKAKKIKKENYKPKEISKFSDQEVNKLIKEKIGYLNDVKKQFGYNQNLINKLALMNVALKENGIEIDDLFYDTLMKTEIFMTNENMTDLYRRVQDEEEEMDQGVLGMYTFEEPLNIFEEDYQELESKILVPGVNRNKLVDPLEKYGTLIHEVRHALTAQRNASGYYDDDKYFRRCGLNEIHYKKDDEYVDVYGTLIDEAFNENAALKLINTILKYKNNNIDNNEIKRILYCMRTEFTDGYYYSYSYLFERFLIEPLLRNKEIVNLADKTSYNGNNIEFYNLFDDFIEYSERMEDIVYSYDYGDESIDYFKKVRSFRRETRKIAQK